MVEHNLAKVGVASSNLVSRSKLAKNLEAGLVPAFVCVHKANSAGSATKKLGDSLHPMTLREPFCQNRPDPLAWLKASVMTPDKIEGLSVRYTMCI